MRLFDLDDMSGQGGPAHIGGEIGLTTSLDYRGSLNKQAVRPTRRQACRG